MPGLMDLVGQPQSAPQAAPMQPQQAVNPQQAANPLAALAGAPQQQKPMPAPTHAQTVAAMHHLGAIKSAISPVMNDPKLGTTNIRPKLLDAASKLLAGKIMSLPEIMNAIKNLPDDPIQQKAFVEKIYNSTDQAQKVVLMQHRMGAAQEPELEEWSPETHDKHFAGLMQHYGDKNG